MISGPGYGLNEAAREALRKFRFKPATTWRPARNFAPNPQGPMKDLGGKSEGYKAERADCRAC